MLAQALPELDFTNYGILGLVIMAWLTGLIWGRPAVNHILADKRAVEAQRDSLLNIHETQVIPVLTDVQRELVPATSSMAKAVRSMQSQGSRERAQLLLAIQELDAKVSRLTREVEEMRHAPLQHQEGTPQPRSRRDDY